jgi:hypothetical protein
MKDNRLKTSFENYEAFDVIAGSSYGTWSDRETAVEMVKFLDGSINRHTMYDELMQCIAETSDDSMSELLDELANDIDDAVMLDDEYHYLTFHDNEYIVLPAINGVVEDHQESGNIGEELPEVDSTHHTGETFVTVNERGNTSLYRFVDTVTGWQEIWAVV